MKALPEEIELLFEIQDIDLEVMRLEKEFAELPQRKVILNSREAQKQLEEKREKIAGLKKNAERKMVRIEDEDSSLEKKEIGVQAAIEAAGNDFRNAEARTKELDGIFKRRMQLAEDKESVAAELEQIGALSKQVDSTFEEMVAKEEEATEAFKTIGSKLTMDIAKTKKAREAKLEELSPDVSDAYTKTAVHFTTVCVGSLEDGKCSICRSKIESGRLIDLMQDAPLAVCPSCKRLLVVPSE